MNDRQRCVDRWFSHSDSVALSIWRSFVSLGLFWNVFSLRQQSQIADLLCSFVYLDVCACAVRSRWMNRMNWEIDLWLIRGFHFVFSFCIVHGNNCLQFTMVVRAHCSPHTHWKFMATVVCWSLFSIFFACKQSKIPVREDDIRSVEAIILQSL